MGLLMSIPGKWGMPSPLSLTTSTVYDNYFSKVTDFAGFHEAFLKLWSEFNAIMPGKHYNVPSHEDIEDCFKLWTKAEEAKKPDEVQKLLARLAGVSKTQDGTVILTGLVAPWPSLALKRAGEGVPALKKFRLNLVPDAVFVPGCTLLCLFGVKLLQISNKSKALR